MGQAQNIEKQIQLLSTLHIGFMAAGIFFLILAVVLFIYLKIPEVFNEYRGKSAKKWNRWLQTHPSPAAWLHTAAGTSKQKRTIQASGIIRKSCIRNLNLRRCSCHPDSSHLQRQNRRRRPFRARRLDAGATEVLDEQATEVLGEKPTELLGGSATEVLDEKPTEVLGGTETEILDQNAAELLQPEASEEADENATEVLTEEKPTEKIKIKEQGTMVLDASMLKQNKGVFEIERSIVLIHTDKVIE